MAWQLYGEGGYFSQGGCHRELAIVFFDYLLATGETDASTRDVFSLKSGEHFEDLILVGFVDAYAIVRDVAQLCRPCAAFAYLGCHN